MLLGDRSSDRNSGRLPGPFLLRGISELFCRTETVGVLVRCVFLRYRGWNLGGGAVVVALILERLFCQGFLGLFGPKNPQRKRRVWGYVDDFGVWSRDRDFGDFRRPSFREGCFGNLVWGWVDSPFFASFVQFRPKIVGPPSSKIGVGASGAFFPTGKMRVNRSDFVRAIHNSP